MRWETSNALVGGACRKLGLYARAGSNTAV